MIACFSSISQNPAASLKYTSVNPIIDGYIDDIWDTALPHNIDKVFINSMPTLGEVGTTTWQALWTEEGIYFLVKVNDDAWFPYYLYEELGSPWEYDFVEIFFDVNEVLRDGGSPSTAGTGHYILSIEPYKGLVSGGSLLHAGMGVDYSYNVTDPSYLVEIFVSYSELLDENDMQVDRTRPIGFDVTVVDTDTPEPERHRLSWANTGVNGESWSNMDDCGIINLVTESLTLTLPNNLSSVCGDSIQLEPDIFYAGTGELVYSWSPTQGLSAPDIPNPKVSVMTNTTYILNVFSNDFGSIKDSVTINALPLHVDCGPDITIACGENAMLNAVTNYTGSQLINYLWSPASGLSSTTIAEPVVQINSSRTYQLRIETQNGCIATDSIKVTVSEFPEIPSICLVDVNENDNSVVVVRKNLEDAIEAYLIYRESSLQTNYFDLIGSIPYEEEAIFIDTLSNAKQQSYKYAVAIKDRCGFVSDIGDSHKTLHLSINKGTGNDWNLFWEAYEGAAISSYKIFRGTSRTDLIEISNVSGSSSTFTDIDAPEGDIYYRVEGILTESCSSLKSIDYAGVSSNISSNATTVNKETHFQSSLDLFYPNPAHDFIQFNSEVVTNAHVEIYNIQGSQVLSRTISDRINISELKSGFYTVKLVEAGSIHHAILVKE